MAGRIERTIRIAAEVCQAVGAGDFEARVKNIRDTGALGSMLWSINRLIDRSDAFVREAGAAMGCVARNRYHRKIVETGMVGGFLVGARRINEAAGVIAEKMTEFQRVRSEERRVGKECVSTG